MDDVLRRLGVVESLVAQTREDVSAIKAAFSHLATKANFGDVKADVSAIKATLPHLATKEDVAATKADINEVRGDINGVRAEINALEARIIRWIVGTTIAAASVAFTIAKFVH